MAPTLTLSGLRRKVTAMATTPCQVCRATLRRPFAEVAHPGFGSLHLWQCAECDFVYLDPMPPAEALAALYDSDTGAGYCARADAKLRRARGRIRQLSRHVTGDRFLDVGCNGGFMVEAARLAGLNAQGLDPDAASIGWAAQAFPACNFSVATLEDFAAREVGAFDALYCSEVIEHSPDCDAFAAALHRLSAPGAVLYLTTPDISHWRRPRNLDAWDAFKPPEHCLYFSPGNLALLLERHGFTILRRRPAFKPGIKILARRTSGTSGP